MKMWTFTDLITSDVYTFPINPNKMDRLFATKQLATYPSSVGALTTRAAPEPYEWTFGGNCRGKDMHDALLEWTGRKHELRVSDHLAREFTILPIVFDPADRRSHREPWRFTYTIRSLMTDQYGGGLR
jgi:hypothetical protein